MTRAYRAEPARAAAPPAASIATPLHRVGTNIMAGLMETLAGPPYNGRADLPRLAESLQLEADELLPLGETLQLLQFAVLEEGDIQLTRPGVRSSMPTPRNASGCSPRRCARMCRW